MLTIQSVPSPNHFDGRFGYVPHWLILHGTAGFETASQVAAYFGSTASQVSSNYIVGRGENEVIQCVDERDGAWANGPVTGPAGVGGDGVHHDSWWDTQPNPNYVTISIEHVKPSTDNSDQLTAAQKAASFALIFDICKRQHIPMRAADSTGGITGHFSMDPVNRSRCPGPYPWDDLWAFLKQQGGNNVTPNQWQIADAQKEWNSTASLFGGTAPRYDSGIAAAWKDRVYQGKRPGPPLSAEYASTDWNGNAIRVQQFANARAEWNNGTCRWFDARGEIV